MFKPLLVAFFGLGFGLSLGVVAGCADAQPAPQADAAPKPASFEAQDLDKGPFSVLVFSKTAKYRHKSIPAGNTMLVELGQAHGFSVEVTEDAKAFTDDNLKRFAVVVFHNTTGDVLDEMQEDVFERFIQAGGGFAGVHAATDTEYDWPWYNQLVGAYFAGHPKVQPARHDVVDGDHPSTQHLPPSFNRTDEWYDFKKYNDEVNVLLTLDETSYNAKKKSAMGDFHPIAWYHAFDGGRAWYTGGGHTKAAFSEPAFRQHVLGGIFWAAGRGLPETSEMKAEGAEAP